MTAALTLFPDSAVISECGRYRYSLTRRWAPGPLCVWCMLNPSTADATTNDATIRRCIGFAKRWGYTGIVVVNLYPLRCTNPREMLRQMDRFGRMDRNTNTVLQHVHGEGTVDHVPNVICAWGNGAEPFVASLMVDHLERAVGEQNVLCLGVTRSGAPKHPVRLPYSAQRVSLSDARCKNSI